MLHSRHVWMLGGGGGIRLAAERGGEECGKRNSGTEELEVEPETTLVRAATMRENSWSVVIRAGKKEEEEEDMVIVIWRVKVWK